VHWPCRIPQNENAATASAFYERGEDINQEGNMSNSFLFPQFGLYRQDEKKTGGNPQSCRREGCS
jgi:hypothetical protein